MIRLPLTLRLARCFNRLPLGILLTLVISMAACGRETAGSATPVVPSPISSPPAAPQATETTPPLLAPTATLFATATANSPAAASAPVTAQAACDFEYFFHPAPGTCPAAAPVPSAAAEQPFEGGVLIWLEQSGSVIAFYNNGRWQRFDDTWSEGQPESDPSLIPPADRFQPIRGFGKVWREQPEVRDALGWALGVELGFESTIQDQATIPDRPDVTYVRTYNGQIFALVKRGLDEGDWALAADNR